MLGSEARRADGGDRVFCGLEGGGSRGEKNLLVGWAGWKLEQHEPWKSEIRLNACGTQCPFP